MHRRENLCALEAWFKEIEDLADLYPQYSFVFPAHPNPTIRYAAGEVFKKVKVIDPLPHSEMLERIANCKLVITDSGGIQEECSWFKKLCLVCRTVTERPSQSAVMCRSPHTLKDNFKLNHKRLVTQECPFGDGNASRKITEYLCEEF